MIQIELQKATNYIKHILIVGDFMIAYLASGYVVEEFLGTLYLGFFSTFQLHGI